MFPQINELLYEVISGNDSALAGSVPSIYEFVGVPYLCADNCEHHPSITALAF